MIYHTLFLLISFCTALQSSEQQRATELVKESFAEKGLHLSPAHKADLQELIYHTHTATQYQQAQAAQNVAKNLENVLNEKQKKLNQAADNNKPLMLHNAGIVLTQKRHLESFARAKLHTLNWIEYIHELISHFWNTTKTTCFKLFNKQYKSKVQTLSEQLEHYYQLEREYLFANYDQAQHWLIAHRNKKIPELLQSWNNHHAQFTLLKGVKKFTSQPKIQAADIAAVVGEAVGEAAGEAGTEATVEAIGDGTVLGASAAEAAEIAAAFEEIMSISSDLMNMFEVGEDILPITEEAEEAAAESTGNFEAALASDTASSAGETSELFAATTEEANSSITELAEDIENFTQRIEKEMLMNEIKESAAQTLGKASEEGIPYKVVAQKIATINEQLSTLAEEADVATDISEDFAKNFKEEVNQLQEEAKNTLKSAKTASRGAQLGHTAQMIIDMSIQMALMMGGQLAVNWVDVADAKMYADLTKKRNDITAKFHADLAKITATRNGKIKQLQTNFSAKMLELANSQKNMVGILSSQKNYLLQSLVNASINTLYVGSPMELDEYFYLSSMITPIKAQVPLFNAHSPADFTLPQKNTSTSLNKSNYWNASASQSDSLQTQATTWAYGESTDTNQTRQTPASLSTQAIALPSSFPKNAVPHTWYNIFRKGNWQFDKGTNSFYQYQAVPVATKEKPNGDPQQALYNSIFTDYIPPTIINSNGIETYVIQAEIQIYDALYPFFAGIVFNSGRWVSGVLDLFYQHRMFGISAVKEKALTPVAGETFYVDPKNRLKKLDAIWPLRQIFATEDEKKAWESLSSTVIKNPLKAENETQPVSLEINKTYILTIATQPEKMMVSIEEKGKDKQRLVFGPYTINNRNPFVFIYNNIGFVAAGCSARFTLLKPEQLVYDAAALESFSKSIASSGGK
jgi:hypothetical protein